MKRLLCLLLLSALLLMMTATAKGATSIDPKTLFNNLGGNRVKTDTETQSPAEKEAEPAAKAAELRPSMVNPKVFKEPGWSKNEEKIWIYKAEYPFTEYETPQYGYCTAHKVNVRKVPDITWRKWGQLIEGAPLIILGDCMDTFLCDTAFGQGWIPKGYIEFLESEEDYYNYRTYHPSIFNSGGKDNDGDPDIRDDDYDPPGRGPYPDYNNYPDAVG